MSICRRGEGHSQQTREGNFLQNGSKEKAAHVFGRLHIPKADERIREVVDSIKRKKQTNKSQSSVAGFGTNDVDGKTPTVDRICFHAVIRNENLKLTTHH